MSMRTAERPHYAFVVLGLTFLSLLAAAGLRSAPSVLIMPLQAAFGWSRATVSAAAGVGILLYGLVGPFAAALMQNFGIRRVLLAGLGLMAAATLLSLGMREAWQYVLTWGVLSGLGSGAVASVLAATVVNRWFAKRQGLMMGLLTASTATGSLLFLPLMAWLAGRWGWRAVAGTLALTLLAIIPLVWRLMPERPEDVQQARYGETPHRAGALPATGPLLAFTALRDALGVPAFWVLAGSFFVCGLTTNGLVGTHLIAYCGDRGIAPVKAAGLMSMMGLFDLLGTTASGWLTDRYDARGLLFAYYGLRGLSLLALPLVDFAGLSLAGFVLIYGLDWVATVPPTVRLVNAQFGQQRGPLVYGWIFAAHQIGAATAAVLAGLVRQRFGAYDAAFFGAGILAVLVALLALRTPIRPLSTA